MIIRMSLCRDNDFTGYISEFCLDREFWCDVNVALDLTGGLFATWNMPRYTDDDCKAYEEMKRKQSYLLGLDKKWKKGSAEYDEICKEVKSLWVKWVNDRNKQLPLDLDVSIQYSLTEHDENGEVCYYFSCTGQCLIM